MFVQLTIPRGTVELGRVIDACIARCVERWGGCTVTDGMGYWRNPDCPYGSSNNVESVAILGVECEPGCVGHCCNPSYMVREWFDNLAGYVRVEGKQHTVYYRMFEGGEGRFVGPDTIIAPTCVEDRVNAKMQAAVDALRGLQR